MSYVIPPKVSVFSPKALPSFLRVALFLLCGWLAGNSLVAANPFVSQLFSSHMVLQRDAIDPVWGWTTSGNTVTVVMKDQNGATLQTKTAVADSSGRWQTAVGPFAKVTGNAAYSMTISAAGQTTATLTDVLIGDVFLCSGQSNMQYSLNTINVINLSQEIADSANYPQVRCFAAPLVPTSAPQVTLTGGTWQVAGPATTGNFSATAYFSAREIYKQQGVPVGIVVSAWPGTQIQAWVDALGVSSISDFSQTSYDQAGQAPTSTTLSGLFNGMIAPLAPLRVRAVVWYQGESNYTAPEQYSRLLSELMDAYSTNFGQPQLPFIVIQLPNINGVQTWPVETGSWAEIRESQEKIVTADPNARLVTTLDIGGSIPFNNNSAELHPKDKQDVGLRVARAAANLIYGQNVVNQGPLFTGATIAGNTITCTFNNVGSGLMVGSKDYQTPLSPVQQVVGGTLKGFAVAGSNHTFYAATATITGTNTVAVSSSSVSAPLYVRYAWGGNPQSNLYNKITDGSVNVVDGLPAGSFRNDPVNRLTVNSGSGGGVFYAGGSTQVGIAASTLTGQSFRYWTGDTDTLANANSMTTTATVAQKYVSVLANYQITGAPTGFSTTSGIGGVTLNWTAMSSVHYSIKRSTSPSGPFVVIASNLMGTTSFVDTTAADGVTYYYVISAANALGEGPNSTSVSGVTIPVVHNVRLVHANAQAPLAWDVFSGAVDHYNVKRSTTSGGPYATLGSTTSLGYTDATVSAGVIYYYVVTAVSGGVESAASTELVAVPTFLPMPMQDTDVGVTGPTGGAYATASGVYTLTGAGYQVGSVPDSCNFAYLKVTGDCSITARVATLGTGGSSPQAGVMIRGSLDPAGTFARTYVDPTQNYYQGRGTVGGGSGTSVGANSNRWVRVVRTSGVCKGYTSADGLNWIQQGTPVNVVSSAPVYVGLMVCSRNGTLNTTSFDNVAWTGAVETALQNYSIGSVGISGGAYGTLSDSVTVQGAGSQIGTSPDSFDFACTQIQGDCTITARVASLGTAGSYPEAGVMIRTSLSADSIYTRTFVNPTRIYYQGRYVTGGGTGTSTAISSNRWVRVVRSGGVCTGYTSPDGSVWTQQGTPVTVSSSAPIYAGLAVCSRNSSVLNTTVFDNITITGTAP
ncbi:MAG TPA: sialate O-acetylesterase [Rariglobus sp.]|nr:sialate O-acetylesterase [Rariglobus sp.]